MAQFSSRDEIEAALEELVSYQELLDRKFPEDERYKFLKSYKQFLMEQKIEEIVDKLIQADNEKILYKIDEIVTEDGGLDFIAKSELLLEWEAYKKIPKTNLTYRYDKGKGTPGMEDHIHVFLDNNQVYAINKSGSPHDGSRAQLGKKEIKFLRDLGFEVPPSGLLEWRELDLAKNYTAYKRRLLLD